MTTKECIIHNALLRVADNVAKHTIQRNGWHEDDKCFQVDLRLAEEELHTAIREAVDAEGAALRKAFYDTTARYSEASKQGRLMDLWRELYEAVRDNEAGLRLWSELTLLRLGQPVQVNLTHE